MCMHSQAMRRMMLRGRGCNRRVHAFTGEGTWWTYPAGERSFTASSYEGAEESIDAVEKAIVEGDFVGLLGFSQGAMLAAIVAARATLGEGPKLPLQFAIMCGGAMPNPYRPLLDRLRQRGEVGVQPPDSVLPTLHCISESDRVNPVELGRELATCFAPRARTRHSKAMPSEHTARTASCLGRRP